MLCSQLDEMKANGVENVCIHPMPRSFRPDSIDSSMSPDYLTPEYFEVYARVTRHAARLGMHSYLYDEGGWPSGSACGLVAAGDREGNFRMRSVQLDGDDRPVVVAEPYVGPAPRTSIVEKGMTEEILGTDPKNLRVFAIFRLRFRFAAGAVLKRRGGCKRGDFLGGAAQKIGFTSIMFRLKAKADRASCSCRRNCTGNDRAKWTIPLENMVKS